MFALVTLIVALLGSAAPAYAYPEYLPFAETQFANSTGMFRWWQSCWWQVFDPYVYLQCQPNGEILIILPDGTVTPASEADLQRLFDASGGVVSFNAPGTSGSRLQGISRLFPGRTSAAPGDGIRLSDYYGGTFRRFEGMNISRFDGIGSIGETEFGVFRFHADGTRDYSYSYSGNDATWRFANGSGDSTQRIFGDDVPTSDDSGGYEFSGGNTAGRTMDDFFYEPIGLIGCDSINDSRDGGIFGPIPCTSYPGVFGPVPEY